jgi:hypothetical protein
VADRGHDERQLQPDRQIAQLNIVGKRHRRIVEGGVLLEMVARLAGRARLRDKLLVMTEIELAPAGSLPRSEYKSKLVEKV